MREDLERLAHLAVVDLEARKEWARALKRSGDPRAMFVELSIEPGADQWLELCKQLNALSHEDQDAVAVWLDPLLSHWTNIYLNFAEGSDVSTLAKLTKLAELGLYFARVSHLSALTKLTNLTSLRVGYTHVSDVSALAKLTNLKTLSVANTPIRDASALASLTNLKSLCLRYTQVSNTQINALQKQLPQCRIIS